MNRHHMQNLISSALLIGALGWLFSSPLRADVTGTILGTARDASGSVLANVNITISNVGTNLSRSTLTDTNGDFRFLSLPAGTYRVEGELAGFQTFAASNLVLTV